MNHKIIGAESEIVAEWSAINPSTPVRILMRHCTRLEVPSALTNFSRLKTLKFYNSTITSWSENAALSQKYHPELMMLFLVRVNMTGGEFPAGLRGDDFPHLLQDIEFCETNLRALPEDLDLKWPQYASIYFEAGQFTEVPPALARLASYDFSIAKKPISSIPASLFEGNVGFLHVGGTLISELPRLVTNVPPFLKLRVDGTNISFFWDWVDPIAVNAGVVLADVPTILATDSPYCRDLQRIYDKEITSFSSPWHEGQSSILSDASVENWEVLKKAVSCEQWPETWYPIDLEDEYSGIKV